MSRASSQAHVNASQRASKWGALVPRFAWPLAVLMLSACCHSTYHGTYTRLRVTNPRGELIADWVAVGPIWPVERGYCITAVERISGPPRPILTRYPDGWRTAAVGPNIRHWRCPAPDWLQESDADGSGRAGEWPERRPFFRRSGYWNDRPASMRPL